MGAEPSWRPDPVNAALERWWDGAHWTDHVRDRAQQQPAPQSRREVKQAAAKHVSVEQATSLPENRQEGRPSRVLAVATQVILAFIAFGAGLALVGLVSSYNSVTLAAATGKVSDNLWEAAKAGLGSSVILYFILLALAGAITGVWYVVRANDPRVNSVLLRRTPWVSVVSALIPVLQLWWPVQGMKDLWHASRPEMARSAVKRKLPVPASIFLWWMCLIGSAFAPAGVVALVIFQIRLSLPLPSVAQVTANTVEAQQALLALLTGAMAWTFALAVLSVIALITVVAQIERHLSLPDAPAGQEYRILAGG